MIKRPDLQSFSLYEYLKYQNDHGLAIPFFLANNETYKNAHVNFPFRTFTYGIGITYAGGIDKAQIGNIDYDIKPGCMTTIGPGIVCTWKSNYSAVHDTLYFTEDLFDGYPHRNFLQSLEFFAHGGRHVISLDAAQINKITLLFDALKALKDDIRVIAGVVHGLLMYARSIHTGAESPDSLKPVSAKERIIMQFRKAVAEQYREHKEVAYYAAALNITPKYLSEVLQDELGKNAKRFIDEYVAMEAKSLLKQTSLTIQEICYFLGYEDASSFTKFFKKQTAVTPSFYRGDR